ncbi:hypothetical protein TorRG33x02_067760 [Trema orientale]|uniref:Uncharacterized protein n=1 Tax=Trema orientale TaxID=63057 RepID=A0A2P5FHP4_TREOI|nr:hypothetical protein TorRG33x02_067760 [Trema orientale]
MDVDTDECLNIKGSSTLFGTEKHERQRETVRARETERERESERERENKISAKVRGEERRRGGTLSN